MGNSIKKKIKKKSPSPNCDFADCMKGAMCLSRLTRLKKKNNILRRAEPGESWHCGETAPPVSVLFSSFLLTDQLHVVRGAGVSPLAPGLIVGGDAASSHSAFIAPTLSAADKTPAPVCFGVRCTR